MDGLRTINRRQWEAKQAAESKAKREQAIKAMHTVARKA